MIITHNKTRTSKVGAIPKAQKALSFKNMLKTFFPTKNAFRSDRKFKNIGILKSYSNRRITERLDEVIISVGILQSSEYQRFYCML